MRRPLSHKRGCAASSCYTNVRRCGLRDREDILPLMVYPAQCQLPCCAPLLICDGLQLFYQLKILQVPGRVSVEVNWTGCCSAVSRVVAASSAARSSAEDRRVVSSCASARDLVTKPTLLSGAVSTAAQIQQESGMTECRSTAGAASALGHRQCMMRAFSSHMCMLLCREAGMGLLQQVAVHRSYPVLPAEARDVHDSKAQGPAAAQQPECPTTRWLVQHVLLAHWGCRRSGAEWQQHRDLPAQLDLPIHMTDLVQCFLLKPGGHRAEVLLPKVAGRPDCASQHAPAERAVCSHHVQASAGMRMGASAWQNDKC